MATAEELLRDFNRGTPENAVRRVEGALGHLQHNIMPFIKKELPPHLFAELTEMVNHLDAFFHYVYPVVEPIAYRQLGDSVLISKRARERFHDHEQFFKAECDSLAENYLAVSEGQRDNIRDLRNLSSSLVELIYQEDQIRSQIYLAAAIGENLRESFIKFGDTELDTVTHHFKELANALEIGQDQLGRRSAYNGILEFLGVILEKREREHELSEAMHAQLRSAMEKASMSMGALSVDIFEDLHSSYR
jgi:hypothetical protein